MPLTGQVERGDVILVDVRTRDIGRRWQAGHGRVEHRSRAETWRAMPCRCLLSEVEWRGDDRLRLARLAAVPQILGLLHLIRLDEWRAEEIGLVVDRPGGRVAETVGEGLPAVLDPVLRRREVERGRLAQVESAVDVDRTVGCRAGRCRAY